MKQSMFLNTRNWYCVERTCFWISSSGSAGSNAVRIAYTAGHTQSCFAIFRFMARGQSPLTIVWFCSFGLNFFCCLHLLGYDKVTQVWAFLSVTPSNARSFPLKLHLYKQLLRLKGATASLKLWPHCLKKMSVKRRISKIAFVELTHSCPWATIVASRVTSLIKD